jgi:hypothetical protein
VLSLWNSHRTDNAFRTFYFYKVKLDAGKNNSTRQSTVASGVVNLRRIFVAIGELVDENGVLVVDGGREVF